MGTQGPAVASEGNDVITLRALLLPHRIAMMAVFAALVLWCAFTLRWDWIPKYAPLAARGYLAHDLAHGRDFDSSES